MSENESMDRLTLINDPKYWEEIDAFGDKVEAFVNQKRPMRATYEDGQWEIWLPIRMRGSFDFSAIYLGGTSKKDFLEIGYSYFWDSDDYQECKWEPEELPEEQWKHYLDNA